jgi:hypothetical protein
MMEFIMRVEDPPATAWRWEDMDLACLKWQAVLAAE